MGYPHYSDDCCDHHHLVRDFGPLPTNRYDLSLRPEIIVLCGSTRFKDEINRTNADLTMQGKLVISLGVFGHVDMPAEWDTADDTRREEIKAEVAALSKEKA